MPSQLNSSLSQEPDSTVLSDNTPKLDSLVAGRNSLGSDTSGRNASAKSEPNGNVKPVESELSFHDFLPEEQNVTGPKQGKAEQKNSSQNGQQRGKSSSEGNGNSGSNSGSSSGSNRARGKGRSQRNDGDSNSGNGGGGNGNNKKSNGRRNNNKGRNQKQAHKAQPQDVDGNRDPDCVGEVGTSLNLTLSKALMVKLKRQAKSEGVSMEALATELISEGAVLRAWEIVERKGHLRDASANQSGNSYGGNGNGGGGNQRRGNGNRQHKNGNGNGNSRNMNKQRYNAIMDDKANFLEYVRNQEKFNR